MTSQKTEDRRFRTLTKPFADKKGMSLRDYFAAKAAMGIIAAYLRPDDVCMCKELVAKAAYNIADAMLAERERKP